VAANVLMTFIVSQRQKYFINIQTNQIYSSLKPTLANHPCSYPSSITEKGCCDVCNHNLKFSLIHLQILEH